MNPLGQHLCVALATLESLLRGGRVVGDAVTCYIRPEVSLLWPLQTSPGGLERGRITDGPVADEWRFGCARKTPGVVVFGPGGPGDRGDCG